MELLVPSLTVLSTIPELTTEGACSRYCMLRAANVEPRFLPDLIMDASCSRRTGDILHCLIFYTLYMDAWNPAKLMPLTPNPHAGWPNGNLWRQAVAPIQYHPQSWAGWLAGWIQMYLNGFT